MKLNNKICIYDNCNKKHVAKGYCSFHYVRIKNNIPLDQEKQIKNPSRNCIVHNCKEKYYGKNYCYFHWHRSRQNIDLNNPKKIQDPTRPCIIFDCKEKYYGNGYCKFHYQRIRNGTNINKLKCGIYRFCKFKKCNTKSRIHGYCRKHYNNYINPQSNCGNNIYMYIAMMNVRKRDNNSCKWDNCSKSAINGDSIVVHHIFPRSEYPELMYLEEYMICYCKFHHREFHKYRKDKYWKFISI